MSVLRYMTMQAMMNTPFPVVDPLAVSRPRPPMDILRLGRIMSDNVQDLFS